MAGDFTKPATTDSYSAVLSGVRDLAADLAKGLDGTGTLSPPTSAIKFNGTTRRWEKNTGTPSVPVWGELVAQASNAYDIRVAKADQLTTARTITLGGALSGSVAFNGSADITLNGVLATVPETKGGTNQTTWTLGDILVASGANTLAKLAGNTAATRKYLTQTGNGTISATPAWAALLDADIPATLTAKTLGNTNTVTLLDNQFTLQDQTDSSKQAQFDLAALSAATTRTYALPNANVTLMGTSEAATVTNKTFSGAGCVWNGAVLSVTYGGLGNTTFTSGDILRYNGTNMVAATGAELAAKIAANFVTNATNATNATYLGATQQTSVITGASSSLSMSMDDGATKGSFVCRSAGTGDAGLAGMTFHNDTYAVKMGVRADGYIGIGGWSRGAWSWYSDPSGNMVAAGNVTAYSDPRLKKNVRPIQHALALVEKLRGVRFVWKKRIAHIANKAGKPDLGILADEVAAVFPEIVHESIKLNGKSYQTVAYDKLVPVLIEAIKELSARVRALEAA